MNGLAGFNIHRGCLALVRRPATPTLDRIAAGPLSRVLVLEGRQQSRQRRRPVPQRRGVRHRARRARTRHAAIRCIARRSAPRWPRRWRCRSCSAPQWPGAIADLRDRRLYRGRADTGADAPRRSKTSRPHAKLALLVGSEGGGLTRGGAASGDATRPHSDDADVDSLNVTTAASIAMYHCFAEKRS